MPTFDVFEAKSNLSKLLEAIESGQEEGNGLPVAKLAPLTARPSGKRLGVAKGLFKVPGDIDQDNLLIAGLFMGEAD